VVDNQVKRKKLSGDLHLKTGAARRRIQWALCRSHSLRACREARTRLNGLRHLEPRAVLLGR
jgi:hypothetical protein